MKNSILAVLSLTCITVLSATCPANGNNCARAVTGTFQNQQSSRRQDCSSYQQCTVRPATMIIATTTFINPTAVTTTTTTTATLTVTVDPRLAGRKKREASPNEAALPDHQALPKTRRGDANEGFRIVQRQEASIASTNCPSATPTHASVCSGTMAYASACSCAGVTKSYATLPSPSISHTITSTIAIPSSTATFTATVTNTVAPLFIIRLGNSGSDYATIYPPDLAFAYSSVDSSQAVQFDIFNGILTLAGNRKKATVVSDQRAAGNLIFASPDEFLANYQEVSANFGAFDATTGGYVLNLQVGEARVLVLANLGTPTRILAAPSSDQRFRRAPQLYAIFV